MGDLLQSYGDASGAFVSATLVHRKLAVPCFAEGDRLLDALGLRGLPLVRRMPTMVGMAESPTAAFGARIHAAAY